MSKPGFSWLILNLSLIGSLALPGLVRAQAPDQALTLELLQRIEQLEREVRYIRGELEVYRHQVENLQRERAATVSSTASSTSAQPPTAPASATDPATPASADPALATPPAPAVAASGTEEGDFEVAIDHLRAGRHPEAIADLQRFLKTWPAGGRADDAQYWLGEAYYRSRNYPAAREAFINLGLHFPESKRLPDALLKLGLIYGETGDPARAREVWQKLIQVYPDTEAAGHAQERLPTLR
jgi:tol-pal system protein YbgF